MSVLATTDHRGGEVTIPKTSGGCGRTHRYEDMPAGYPGITCADGCEDVLRKDALHATVASMVPETHDEKLIREDLEQRGARNQQQMTAMALAKLANIPGADEMFGAAMGATVAMCPDGHQNAGSSRFCAQCGQPVSREPRGSLCPEGHPAPGGSKFCPSCGTAMPGIDTAAVTAAAGDRSKVKLNDRRLDELQGMCRDQGLADDGTRAVLIQRLRDNA